MLETASLKNMKNPIYPCKSKANCENNDAERTRESAANVIASRNDGFKRAL